MDDTGHVPTVIRVNETELPSRTKADRLRMARYAVVSGVKTLLGVVVLAALVAVRVPAGIANFVGVFFGIAFAVAVNRRFVWEAGDAGEDRPIAVKSPLLVDFVAATGAAATGLVLSTLAVVVADIGSDDAFILGASHLIGFVAAWPLQYLLLDRYFRSRRSDQTGPVPRPGSHQLHGSSRR